MARKERINRPLAEAVRAMLVLNRDEEGAYHLPPAVTSDALIKLAQEALGNELSFYPEADQLVWNVARHQGYVIPACPVASRGDAKEFLSEYGVKNAEDWYRQRGFDERTLRSFYATSALMARNTSFWRKVVPVPKLSAAKADSFAPCLVEALDFCLGYETAEDDGTLFRC